MYLVIIIVALIGFGFWALNLPVFGSLPEQERLTKIKNLQNYGQGELKNRSLTPTLPEGVSYWDIILGMLKGNKNGRPAKALPFLHLIFQRSKG
jgi:hypothetical protein